jgi:hypothetical protein
MIGEIPSFFTPDVLDQFYAATKGWIKWAAPLILIIFALFITELVSGNIIGIFYKKKMEKEDYEDEDEFDVYRY